MENIQEPMTISMLIIIALFFVFIGIPMLLKSSKVTKTILGDNEQGSPTVAKAKVLSKKTYSPHGSLERFNFIIFEKETGERIELAIKNDEEYRMILEEDHGTLTHLGKRYISFERT